LPVVVRTSDDTHIEALKQAGAAEVVAEVLEGSMMLASQALLLSGVPLSKVIRRIQETRAHRYSMFGGFFRTAKEDPADATDSFEPRFQSIRLNDGDAAIGKTLDEINLDKQGVTVNAVRRHNVRGNQPAGDMVLQAGDVLVLLGQPVALTIAEQLLRGKSKGAALQ
jgi:CPA2 family monovalent cation:H+ antiporter-2